MLANDQTRALTENEAEYSKRLFDAVLETVIMLNAVPGTEGGYVAPHIVRAALVDVIATVDNNCGIGATRAERRRDSDFIAKRYEQMMKSLQGMPAMADWPQATLVQDASRLN